MNPASSPLARFLLACALFALLPACAPRVVRTTPPADAERAEAMQLERERTLAADASWSFAGRIALSSGQAGGSGRLDWAQDGADFDVRLSAPVTRQGWRLHRVGERVRLEGLDGGPREGVDAEALLQEATGWRLPIADLPAWVRGVRGNGTQARVEYDADGRLAVLEQSGWRVEYRGWSADPLPMPTKIHARRADASVRLAIESWTAGP
jgi:outer membrane lipoprotein LolB